MAIPVRTRSYLAIAGLAIALIVTATALISHSQGKVIPISTKPLADFSLLDHNGNMFELKRGAAISGARAIAFIFIGVGCPIAEKSFPTVEKLAADFTAQKIDFVFVDSNPQDDRSLIAKEAADFHLTRPILLDQAQIIADSLGVDRTATAVVVETKDFQTIYQGSVDDQHSYVADQAGAQHHFLRDALEDFLAGRALRTTTTKVRGCAISKRTLPSPITYYDHVAPILSQKCLICHSGADGAPPRNLDSYESVKGWAAMIAEVVREQRMPPGGADPYYGEYQDSLDLTAEEQEILMKWGETGAIAGHPRPLRPSQVFTRRYLKSIRHDISLPAASVRIPANSSQSLSVVFLGRAPHDLWIEGDEHDSNLPGLIHHLALVVTSHPLTDTGGVLNDMPAYLLDPAAKITFLISLNKRPEIFPPGYAWFVPRGAYLYLEQGVAPSGKEELLRTTLHLQLGDPAKLQPLIIQSKGLAELTIPPNTRNYTLNYEYTFTDDVRIYRVGPHMHVRGSSAKVKIITPDGTERIILSVPRYYFYAQRRYFFSRPIPVKKGWKLRLEVTYDNSPFNVYHVDSSKPITYGQDNFTKEMGSVSMILLPARGERYH